METSTAKRRRKLFRWVMALAILTVIYNFAEGAVATYFGIQQETLTLLGFGADSFIETISALGVVQMVVRIWRHPASDQGAFEISALRITGWCFYGLSAILLLSAALSVGEGHQPLSTFAGVIIAFISIASMWALVYAKLRLGRKLDLAPVIADARCNLVCIYMSVALLISSILWWLFHIPYIDVAGSLALVFFSVSEGKEAFEKAKGLHKYSCS